MSARRQQAIKAATIFLLFSILQVYVQASLMGKRESAKGVGSNSGRGAPILGKLVTVGNKPILVNGIHVPSGTTILSGMQLETPQSVGAAIIMGQLGRLDIAPKSGLTLLFSQGDIEVNLVTGCMILTTYEGTKGTVKIAGKTIRSIGSEKRAFTDVCKGGPDEASVIVDEGAAAKAGAGICWAVGQFPVVVAGGFNPWWLIGAAPLAAGGLYAGIKDRRPPAISSTKP